MREGWGRIERGERITPEDCRGLLDVRDLNRLSQLSRIARERRFGTDTHFTVARPVSCHPGDAPDALRSSSDENGVVVTPEFPVGDPNGRGAVEELAEYIRSRTGTDLLLRLDPRQLRELAGDMSVREFIAGLGTDTLLVGPGGGFSDDRLWGEGAMTPERWLAIHSGAHDAGIASDAGVHYHDEADPDALVRFMAMIRDLQDRTGRFRSIVPIPFTRAGEKGEAHRRQPTAALTLRISAIIRLFFDGIDHVATPVRLLDPEISFVALSYGADLVDTFISPREAEVTPGDDRTGILPIISPSERRAEEDLLRLVEERIVEARFRPVPVDAMLRPLRLVEGTEN